MTNPRRMRRGCCNHEIHKIHEKRACRVVCPRLFKILSILLILYKNSNSLYSESAKTFLLADTFIRQSLPVACDLDVASMYADLSIVWQSGLTL